MRTQKRDHACIWVSHLDDEELISAIFQLQPGERITILVNRSLTTWVKMNNGKDGRPTNGIRIIEGKHTWQRIPFRDECEILLLNTEDTGSHPSPLSDGIQEVIPVKSPSLQCITNNSLFGGYLFADYSGAIDVNNQKRSIKLAYAMANGVPQLLQESLTRDSLVTKVFEWLRQATQDGIRMCFGFDHQFGIPFGFLHEIGIAGFNWRQILDALIDGREFPPLEHPSTFAARFNAWCESRGNRPYFYSATKAARYGIPNTDPRVGEPATTLRLTEHCCSIGSNSRPKPFNRVGDNGTVGGQTIMGLIKLRELLIECRMEGIPVKCWPFDGLDIDSTIYESSHVLLEPYPSAIRSQDVPYTDDNDALACALFIQRYDQAGKLPELLNLDCLSEDKKKIVQVEGWIAGHSPLSLYRL